VNLASAAVEWEDCLAKISAAMARLVKVQTTLVAVHQKGKVVPIEKEEKSILVVIEGSVGRDRKPAGTVEQTHGTVGRAGGSAQRRVLGQGVCVFQSGVRRRRPEL